jgi:hypothetical protein
MTQNLSFPDQKVTRSDGNSTPHHLAEFNLKKSDTQNLEMQALIQQQHHFPMLSRFRAFRLVESREMPRWESGAKFWVLCASGPALKFWDVCFWRLRVKCVGDFEMNKKSWG